MQGYAQISLSVIERKREDGTQRKFEFRLMESGADAADLPLGLYGEVQIEHGNRGDDLLKPVKPTSVSFQIKSQTELAEKLINAEPRQFYLSIRETETNRMKFEGYIKPDSHKYDIYKEIQTLRLVATGELATLNSNAADYSPKPLTEVFSQVGDNLGIERSVHFYMRTRYDGQELSDPIPQRIWTRELAKLGLTETDEGGRFDLVQQLCQDFNAQLFQYHGNLVFSDVYERFRNPEAVNTYIGGTTQGETNLLIELDKTNSIRKIGDQDRGPSGKRSTRVGRVVQQRQLPSREEGSFNSPPSWEQQNIVIINQMSFPYDGAAVAGDIIRVNEIAGRVTLEDEFIENYPHPGLDLMFPKMLQIVFTSEVTGEPLYYDFENNEWSEQERFSRKDIRFFVDQSGPVPVIEPRDFSFSFETPEIPEDDFGYVDLIIRKDVEAITPDVTINWPDFELLITRVQVEMQLNDRPDDLFYQVVTESGSGETKVYPIFETDVDGYAGNRGTMLIGEQAESLQLAQSQWIDEQSGNLVPFVRLSAMRKAWLMLGSADRVHLVVRDTTPISLLNVLQFEGKRYGPVAITEHLFGGYQEIWMKPAPGLEFTLDEGYTFNPEEITETRSAGVSRGWVTNQVRSMSDSFLGASAIARTTTVRTGTMSTIEIDRENLLVESDRFVVVNRFTLERHTFTASADQSGSVIPVEPVFVPMIPPGSYVLMAADEVAAGILQSKFATRIFADLYGVGVLTEDVSGQRSFLPVNLYTQVREGQTFGIPIATRPTPIYVTVRREASYEGDELQTFGPGLVNLPIREMVVNAPAESVLTLSGTQLQAYFHVDPGRIVANLEKERTSEAIGTLAEDRSGTISSIALKNIDEEVELLTNQMLRLYNKQGDNESVEVDGDQTLTPSTHTITIVEKTLQNSYTAAFAWVKEPSYKQTGRLTLESARINLNVQTITSQGTTIAGLEIDVTDLESATATLFVEVEGVKDDLEIESQARLDLESDFESATATLTSQFNSLSDDLDTETQARLQLEADLDSATSTLTATIIRVNDAEDDIDDLQSAQSGLIVQVGNLQNAFDDIDDDLQFLGNEFDDLVDDIGAQSVLYTQSNGNVAAINMVSGSTTTAISITTDYLNIQNWQFVSSTGVIRSTTQINGNDAIRLNGVSGLAEFQDVRVRGTLTTVVLETQMEVDGDIYLPSQSNPDIIISPTQGIRIAPGTTNSRAIRFDINATQTAYIRGNQSMMEFYSPDSMQITAENQLSLLSFTNQLRMPGVTSSNPGVTAGVFWREHQNLGFGDRVLCITGPN